MSFMSSISHEVSYSVQGFAGHAPNSLVNNAPALNSILKSLIGFLNFATDTVKWHISLLNITRMLIWLTTKSPIINGCR